MNWLYRIFSGDGFVPRWVCESAWKTEPGWGWLHVISDISIWAASVAVSLFVWRFTLQRKDLPYIRVFLLLSVFIFASGTVHLLDAVIFWWPAYRLSAVAKLLTALISWSSVVVTLSVLPFSLATRPPVEALPQNDQDRLRLKRSAIECATNAIVIIDASAADYPIISVNPAFTWLTGYSSQEVLGRNCRILQGPKTDPATVEEIRVALHAESQCHVTILNYRKDGTPFWNDLRISPIRNEVGRLTHFVGIQSDVTARIEAEWELWKAREDAETANEAKTQFLASMSHEIRTPLTAILGCADLLTRKNLAQESRDLVQAICDQGQLLMRLLNDVLDLAKIEAGKLELSLEPVLIRHLLSELGVLLQPVAQEKGLELRVELDPSLPEEVLADQLRLWQVLINLVNNAIKFTDQGSIVLRAWSKFEGESLRLQLDVIDTGMGIPEECLPHVFNEFYRVGGEFAQRMRPGSGLGLPIVRRLVELHGGTISIFSKTGQGTRFHIEIPVRCPKSGFTEDVSGINEAEFLAERIPIRVLVVEDTYSLQFMLERLLADFVDAVGLVSNGAQAVDRVAETEGTEMEFDVVLMDMQMPVMNGLEATARLRQRGFRKPIIALTACALAAERDACLKAGCSDYLSKPVDRQKLWRTLRDHFLASNS